MNYKNGFTLPLHPYQILTWAIFLFHLVFPCLLIIQNLDSSKSVLFLVFYYTLLFGVLVSGFICTKSNPSIAKSNEPLYLETVENVNFFCTICESYVSKTSKHCGSCDRCVHGFDHHCKWLNNCIGDPNYKVFILLLIFLYFNEVFLFSFEVKILISSDLAAAVYGTILFDTTLNGLITAVVTYLIGIHIMLRFKGMTTYEYIKSNRKSKEKKINPTNGQESKKLTGLEVKKSIIKSENRHLNKSVEENPFSFSVPKASQADLVQLTFQIHFDSNLEIT